MLQSQTLDAAISQQQQLYASMALLYLTEFTIAPCEILDPVMPMRQLLDTAMFQGIKFNAATIAQYQLLFAA
jgi:hypothetical protein